MSASAVKPHDLPARIPLTRNRVIEAGVEYADGHGIEALSMRKLAQSLGVEAMSLYNHVANKSDLLNAMIEAVLSQVRDPDPTGDWKEEIRRNVIRCHDEFLKHRWVCRLMMSTISSGPVRIRSMETLLSTLNASGCSVELVHHAYHAVESHLMGFTLWQTNFPFSAADMPKLGTEFLRSVPADEFPYTVQHIRQHIEPTEHQVKSFEFGLDLILDGIERLRDADEWNKARSA